MTDIPNHGICAVQNSGAGRLATEMEMSFGRGRMPGSKTTLGTNDVVAAAKQPCPAILINLYIHVCHAECHDDESSFFCGTVMLPFALTLALTALPLISASSHYRAVDWSSLLVSERNGVYYQNPLGPVQPLETILTGNGVNMVRQRVFTTTGDYGIDYNIQLARRAMAAGLMFGLNIHYSDTWTNPGLQDIPSSWPRDTPSLTAKVSSYTLDLCNTFARAGLVPETITIGNEINGGLLWPNGKYDQPQAMAVFLHEAARAIRASNLRPTPKIQIHLSHGEDKEQMEWFFDLALKQGSLKLEDFDQQVVSFYPFWGEGATQANLSASLNNMISRYGKDVMVAETNWPIICTDPDYPFPADTKDIPFSPAGQITWMQRTASTLSALPRALGISYWEPAWVHNAVLGSSCEWNCMFDGNAKAYDSIGVFKII
ncbi:hypothetical protein IQ07DRAFT_586068 [Pyrenochaeta sp. DS3sAY3a]|nr:hypothetical protein IQ07DRAFT_586068 [Pyrenochaeta sp. DS3sAY3a]